MRQLTIVDTSATEAALVPKSVAQDVQQLLTGFEQHVANLFIEQLDAVLVDGAWQPKTELSDEKAAEWNSLVTLVLKIQQTSQALGACSIVRIKEETNESGTSNSPRIPGGDGP
jgi:lipid A disaccharide synthetase